MGRRDEQPFNQRTDTGRMGFRHEWEGPDERPLIVYPEPFWADESERLTYEATVEDNPRHEGEGPMAYVARLSALVVGKYGRAVQPMPRARQSRAERERSLAKLRGQYPSRTEIL